MLINKMGYDHLKFGTNCQDFGLEIPEHKYKVVCDGCSEGLHTEVGAKTFCHLMNDGCDVPEAFDKLVNMFGSSIESMKNFLCFTIVSVYENDVNFILSHCGDGFVILEDMDGNISFEELTDGEYPKYYIYNFIESKYLKHYAEGVELTTKLYKKEQYKNVGIASDGLRYLFKADTDLQEEFVECLKSGKAAKVKRFVNRNQNIFKDDLTIIF